MKGNWTKYGKILKGNEYKEQCKDHLSNSPELIQLLVLKHQNLHSWVFGSRCYIMIEHAKIGSTILIHESLLRSTRPNSFDSHPSTKVFARTLYGPLRFESYFYAPVNNKIQLLYYIILYNL